MVNRPCRMWFALATGMLAAAVSASGADVTASGFQSKYYKDFPLFSTFANETLQIQPIEHFGPVGIGIDLLLPPFQMRLSSIEKGSPAEATGKLKVGQMIESINGQVLKDIDPRIILGEIITKAEATDGVIKFMVKETPDAKAEEAIVKIPLLGAYSKTWPLKCPKSDKIVRGEAEFLARTGNYAGPGIQGLGLLFMLSTGEEKDLEVARGWVKELVAKYKDGKQFDTFPWAAGYGGIGLCEYYLRTGDASVLPVIANLADYLKRNMYNGGWNQYGGVNYSYGHLNAAGIPCTAFLLLARECGAKVDEHTLQESFKHFYRFAGHGNVAYGDNMPDSGFVDNGKVGKIAFAMAAAASLTPEGENSVYAKARDISAVKSFYSTSWMLHGHTGGGVGEVWRSASMGLLYDKKPLKYREFMDNRQWFYELSRRHDGSMGIVSATFGGGNGYDNPRDFGIGLALSYTIPRKTLRLTGAPATKFSKPYRLPKRPWGTEADDAFFSMVPAADKTGKVQDWDAEKLATDAAWPIQRRVNDPKATDEVLLMYARHPDQGVREMAAKVIANKPGDALILELLKDKDPRARQAGLMAVNSPARLTDEVAALLIAMVNDTNESWWVVVHAMNRLGMARPELLVPHVDRLCYWLQHEEWWLRKAALTALAGLVTDERFYQKLLPIIGNLAASNWVNEAMVPMGGIVARLSQAKPKVQALASQVLGQAYSDFPKNMVAPGGLDLANPINGPVSPVRFLETVLASNLASLPGGLDRLYELAKKRFPEQALPHREFFLGAPPERLGPKVAEIMKPTILNSLVPEHVGKNWKNLQALAKAEVITTTPGGRNDAVDQLGDLYRRAGDATDYGWHAFGPDRLHNEWAYFTFDPPEKKEWDDKPRYRPVTLPAGMTNWFAKDFDAAKAGWKKGLAPFASKLQASGCTSPFCGCGDKPSTLWDKEVLVIRRTFELPPMKPGHRYRLLVGGRSHVYTGDGWAVYVNGRMIAEAKSMGGMGSGGLPKGAFITTEWFNDFKGGKVVVAAIAFFSPRKDKNNNINIWFEEMKMPPMGEDLLRRSATVIPMLTSVWQGLQDPDNRERHPDEGKFRYDGKFVANPKVLGTWRIVDQVKTMDEFAPGKKMDPGRPMFTEMTFKDNGMTDNALWIWSGEALMDLERYQALKMTVKAIDGSDYLFVEAGGFRKENPVGWKPPLYVMKRSGK